jgi:hypothetical protein
VAASAAVTLPMARPYDVEATFIQELQVPVSAATADILGTPTLTAAQRDYLDLLGNRNGFFDLGDYLALVLRSGQAVPPDVLRAAAGAAARPGRGN